MGHLNVIKITPRKRSFIMADEAASFSTDTLSMSWIQHADALLLHYRWAPMGFLRWWRVCRVCWTTCFVWVRPPPIVNPGMAPCNAAAALMIGRSPKTSSITCDWNWEFTFFCGPNPTTTTSSKALASSWSTMRSGCVSFTVAFHVL